VELLAQARDGNTVLRVLGDHPEDKASVEICSGRYGPYVRHGKVNATIPKDFSPDTITLEEALELIAAKSAKVGKSAGKAGNAKRPPAKNSKATGTPAAKKSKPASSKTKVGTIKPATGKTALAKQTIKNKTASKGKVR